MATEARLQELTARLMESKKSLDEAINALEYAIFEDDYFRVDGAYAPDWNDAVGRLRRAYRYIEDYAAMVIMTKRNRARRGLSGCSCPRR